MKTHWQRIVAGWGSVCLAALSASAACSSSDGSQASSSTGAGAGAPSGGSNGAFTGGFVPNGAGGSNGNGSGAGNGGGCAATFVEGKQLELAMFVMLDQSQSMDDPVPGFGSRWEAVTSAISTFVQSPAAAGMHIGLQYFGIPNNPNGQPPLSSVCDPEAYASAAVPIAELPGNADAIVSSMEEHGPSTYTPTEPALRGAIAFAREWASDNPNFKVVVVLTTDGEPFGCSSSVSGVRTRAAQGLAGSPSIQTFVIGVGDAVSSLHSIAEAGGTEKAYLVSDDNAQDELVGALTEIKGAVLPCSFDIPEPAAGKELDFSKVNVVFTPTGGSPTELSKVSGASECPSDGLHWHYDDESSPEHILLCPATCEAVASDKSGKVDIVLDCKGTIVDPT